MKTIAYLYFAFATALFLSLLVAAGSSAAKDDKGTVTGGSVTGGSVTGGSVTGSSVTGGSVTGGEVTPGTVTPGSVTPGTVTAMAGGREIRVTALGKVTVDVKDDKATVRLDQHVLEVEKARLVLDGNEQGALPAASKKVEIGVQEEMLTVKADGKEVLRAKLEKLNAQ